MSKIGNFAPSREEAVAAALESVEPVPVETAFEPFDFEGLEVGSIFVGLVEGAPEFNEPRHYTPDATYRFDGEALAFVKIEPAESPDYKHDALYRFDAESSSFFPVPEPEPVDATVVEASRSDLFFNYEHTAYESLMRKQRGGRGKDDDKPAPSEEEIRAALLKDAVEFSDTFRNATGIELDREALVADFLKRL